MLRDARRCEGSARRAAAPRGRRWTSRAEHAAHGARASRRYRNLVELRLRRSGAERRRADQETDADDVRRSVAEGLRKTAPCARPAGLPRRQAPRRNGARADAPLVDLNDVAGAARRSRRTAAADAGAAAWAWRGRAAAVALILSSSSSGTSPSSSASTHRARRSGRPPAAPRRAAFKAVRAKPACRRHRGASSATSRARGARDADVASPSAAERRAPTTRADAFARQRGYGAATGRRRNRRPRRQRTTC